MLQRWKLVFIPFFLSSFSPASQASAVQLGATRVIYHASKKEGALEVSNNDPKNPFLVQSWIENETPSTESDSAESNSKSPFRVTPPLFQLEAGQRNALRIVRVGGKLPTDRESLFWLNVKSIPPYEKSKSNQLTILFNQRIKVLYRPSLPGNANIAYQQLRFSCVNKQLQAYNPTPFYISLNSLQLDGEAIDAKMVPPKSSVTWSLPVIKGCESENENRQPKDAAPASAESATKQHRNPKKSAKNSRGANALADKQRVQGQPSQHTITWQAINDYGGVSTQASAQL